MSDLLDMFSQAATGNTPDVVPLVEKPEGWEATVVRAYKKLPQKAVTDAYKPWVDALDELLTPYVAECVMWWDRFMSGYVDDSMPGVHTIEQSAVPGLYYRICDSTGRSSFPGFRAYPFIDVAQLPSLGNVPGGFVHLLDVVMAREYVKDDMRLLLRRGLTHTWSQRHFIAVLPKDKLQMAGHWVFLHTSELEALSAGELPETTQRKARQCLARGGAS